MNFWLKLFDLDINSLPGIILDKYIKIFFEFLLDKSAFSLSNLNFQLEGVFSTMNIIFSGSLL